MGALLPPSIRLMTDLGNGWKDVPGETNICPDWLQTKPATLISQIKFVKQPDRF